MLKTKRLFFKFIYFFIFGNILLQSFFILPLKAEGNDDFLSELFDLLADREFDFSKFPDFNDVYGMKEQKNFLKEKIHFFTPRNKKQYKNLGIKKSPTGLLLEGPPGTGKTYLAKAFAKSANMPFYTFTNGSKAEIEAIFKEARKKGPSIIFVDEAEEVLKERTDPKATPEDNKITNIFLTELDGVKTNPLKPVYFIAATNHINKIDSAIKSRLETLYCGYFSPEEIQGYLAFLIQGRYQIDDDAYYHLIGDVPESLRDSQAWKNFLAAKNDGPSIYQSLIDAVKFSDQLSEYILSAGSQTTIDMHKIKKDNSLKNHSLCTNYNPSLGRHVTELKNDAERGDYFYKLYKHLKDFQSSRKLDKLILKAAEKAGYYGHPKILTSDLDEALEFFLGSNLNAKQVKDRRTEAERKAKIRKDISLTDQSPFDQSPSSPQGKINSNLPDRAPISEMYNSPTLSNKEKQLSIYKESLDKTIQNNKQYEKTLQDSLNTQKAILSQIQTYNDLINQNLAAFKDKFKTTELQLPIFENGVDISLQDMFSKTKTLEELIEYQQQTKHEKDLINQTLEIKPPVEDDKHSKHQ